MATREDEWVLLETPRLRLREIVDRDRPHFDAINADSEIMKYIGPALSAEQSQAFYERIRGEYETRHDLGWFAIDELDGERFVGFAALKHLSEGNHKAMVDLLRDTQPEERMEFGWRFRKPYWGRGYATESGRALVRLALEHHRFPRIGAVAMTANLGSCRAIRKCGLQSRGDYEINGNAARYFVLNRDDYDRQRAGG